MNLSKKLAAISIALLFANNLFCQTPVAPLNRVQAYPFKPTTSQTVRTPQVLPVTLSPSASVIRHSVRQTTPIETKSINVNNTLGKPVVIDFVSSSDAEKGLLGILIPANASTTVSIPVKVYSFEKEGKGFGTSQMGHMGIMDVLKNHLIDQALVTVPDEEQKINFVLDAQAFQMGLTISSEGSTQQVFSAARYPQQIKVAGHPTPKSSIPSQQFDNYVKTTHGGVVRNTQGVIIPQ